MTKTLRTLVPLILALAALPALAQPAAWPTSAQWVAVTRQSVNVTDPASDRTNERDLVGDAANPTAYTFRDASFLYFRVRLDTDPRQGNDGLRPFGWGVLIDSDQDLADYEVMVMVDGISNPEKVVVSRNTVQASPGDPSDPPEQVVATYRPATGWWRVVGAPTVTSTFNQTPDWFLDFAVRWSDLNTAGVTAGLPLRFIFGTSNNGQIMGGDVLAPNGGATITDGASDASTCTATTCTTCSLATACGATCTACDAARPFCIAATSCAECLTTADCGAGRFCSAARACLALPEAAITSGPQGVVNTTSATFTFTGTGAGALTFECRADGGAWIACTSPLTLAALAEGAHSFEVRAKDGFGNVDGTPATRAWTVDLTPPDTTITEGPTGTVASASARFSFTASRAGASFECSLDGAAFAACASPQTPTGLRDGEHTFLVRAKDAAGQVDGTPASRTWTIDTAAPDTVIVAGPSGTVSSTGAVFELSSDEAGATFECRLDGAAFSPCAASAVYAGLADGAHTFDARAVDAAGNVDGSPARRTWTIDRTTPDTTPPSTAITGGPSGTVSTKSATFTFTADEPATFECSLDGGAFASCASPRVLEGLADGAHTFAVRARDLAGNAEPTAATRTWRVDTVAPDTTIASGPSGTVTSTGAVFALTSAEAGVTFECRLDGGAFAACDASVVYSGLAAGAHAFEARAVDAALNVDGTPATRSWTIDRTVVDTTPPDTAITEGPSGAVASASATFTFGADEPSTFECRVDAAAFAACVSPLNVSGLAEGAHAFEVRARDAAGNVDATPATRGWSVDTLAPATAISAGPTGAVSTKSASFTFGASEPGATFECSLDGATFASCATPYAAEDLAEGAHTLLVRARDAVGNVDATPASRTWTVDTTAPDTTIPTGPAGTSSSSGAVVSLASNEAGASFQCRLDAAAFAPCAASVVLADLADGSHTFEARATDAAGNQDPTPATRTWVIDTTTPDRTAPDTAITAGPSGTAASKSATFTFAADETATFECALDGGAFAPCTSPRALAALADGAHTFSVRATDAAGNVDASPASRTWTVDSIAPDTAINAGPSGTVTANGAVFAISSSESGATFECRLDSGAFAPCAASAVFSGLSDGAHTFEARAVDAAGNVDGSPAVRAWVIDRSVPDTTAPQTAITGGPTGTVNAATATFAFAADEPATFECSLDGAAFAACTSPRLLSGLSERTHVFEVRARDASGNRDLTPATRVWTVDTTAPDTTLTAGPTGATTSTSATFAFTTSDAAATFECSLDGAAFSPCTAPLAVSGLASGTHAFLVRAKDAAGNVDPTPATRAWTVDNLPPETTFAAGPSGTVTSSGAFFQLESNEAGVRYECRLDAAAFASCTDVVLLAGLADGPHVFEARATDAAGNVDPTPARRSWVIDPNVPDTTAPETAITAGPAGAVATRAASLSFSADEPATFECSLDGAAFAPCSAPRALANLADGAHTFEVRAKDAAGNVDVTPASRSWIVDLAAPDTTITSGPSGTVSTSGAIFVVGSNEPSTTFECRLDDAPFATCETSVVYSGLAAGAHAFEVRAKDAAGNLDPTPATRAWTIDRSLPDTLAPETSIASGPLPIESSGSATFTFVADETASFECALDDAAFSSCTSPLMLADVADGSHVMRVRARDVAGNVDRSPAEGRWIVDTTAPDTTIEEGPDGTRTSSGAVFVLGADEAAVTFQCNLDDDGFVDCDATVAYADLADGVHVFEARATDAAGNVDDTPIERSWTIDRSVPDTLAPSSVILSGPSGAVASTSANFTFGADEPASFECSLDGAPYADCDETISFTDLSDGPHTLRVRATDAAGNVEQTPSERAWSVDGAPPDTTITAGPDAASPSASATFAFAASEPGGTFACALDDGPEIACTSPVTYGGLSQGSHAFAVRASDGAGNRDGTPATRRWNVDLTAPDTAVASGPAAVTSAQTATFSLTTTEPGAAFQCALDGGAFVPCAASPSFHGLAEGQHVFSARAGDAAGNVDPTPVTRSWRIDRSAPDTYVREAPPEVTTASDATFAFEASEPVSRFECALDGASFATCPALAEFLGLREGPHALLVRAVDVAGNVDPEPAQATWTIDRTAPDTRIRTNPAALVNTPEAAFAFTATEEEVRFECALDGAAFVACGADVTWRDLGEGEHRLLVRSVDRAGNTDATPDAWAWRIDLAAPDTRIDSGPATVTTSANATFTFSSSEPASRFECALDGAALAACTGASFTALATGEHTFRVRAIDAAGNVDASPATRTWSVSAIAPPTIERPAAGARTDELPTFSGTAEPGATVVVSIDGERAASVIADAEGRWSFTATNALATGSHELSVTASDGRGRDSAAATRTFVSSRDVDGDGLLNATERVLGTDPLRPDSDDDDIPDAVETDGGRAIDTDSDGTIDARDPDSDGDGVPDLREGVLDADADGTAGWRDADDDGDTFDTARELADAATLGEDVDGDGVANWLDTDADGDGKADRDEGRGDADGDGLVNYLDPDDADGGSADADADGLSNALERSLGTNPLAKDSDADAIDDAIETDGGLVVDSDGDGTPDALDADSDGDGAPDRDEGARDSDDDETPDYRDTDDDADGISTRDEFEDGARTGGDVDGDGIPNRLDLDSDGDTLTDAIEGRADTNGNAIPEYLDPRVTAPDGDDDGDGLANALEAQLSTNPQRKDSDGDGIGDFVEANGGVRVDTDEDGAIDPLDPDSDGDDVPDSDEGTVDTDADGRPDYRDDDDDGDGLSTARERADAGRFGFDVNGDTLPNWRDVNADGDARTDADEGVADDDADGLPNYVDTDDTDGPTADVDGDGLTNAQEVVYGTNPNLADSDGDGLRDDLEIGADRANPVDHDGDGRIDAIDPDDDGDGVPTVLERGADTDGDELPDYLDTESDGDAIPDAFEAGADPANPRDTDGDGVADLRDRESDGDGLDDAAEAGPDPTDPVDTDGDGAPDFQDRDSDGDGDPDESDPCRLLPNVTRCTGSAPALADPGERTIEAGQELRFKLVATDPDGEALAFSATALPSGATLDAASGEFAWAPARTDAGRHEIRFIVTDPTRLTDAKTAVIVVTLPDRPNAAPLVTLPGRRHFDAEGTFVVDFAVTDPDGDPVVCTALDLPANARWDDAARTVTWAAVEADAGLRAFSIACSDGFATTTARFELTLERVVYELVGGGLASMDCSQAAAPGLLALAGFSACLRRRRSRG